MNINDLSALCNIRQKCDRPTKQLEEKVCNPTVMLGEKYNKSTLEVTKSIDS